MRRTVSFLFTFCGLCLLTSCLSVQGYEATLVPLADVLFCNVADCPDNEYTKRFRVIAEDSIGPYKVKQYACFCDPNESIQQTKLSLRSRLDIRETLFDPDYFPLLVGNTWNYVSYGDSTIYTTFSITEQAIYNEILYSTLSVTAYDSLGDTYLNPTAYLFNDTVDANQVKYILDESEPTTLFRHTYPDSVFEQNGGLAYATIIDEVIVPAGAFQNCIYLTDSMSVGFTFAPNIGLIRVDSMGVVQMELDSYNFTTLCALSATYQLSPVSCYGEMDGAIDLFLTNVSPEISFTWTSPISIENTAHPTGLPAGTYAVHIEDELGCSVDLMDIVVGQPDSISASIQSISDPLCAGEAGGSIQLSVTGGRGAYSYTWNDAAIEDLKDPSGLEAGSYQVTISDANGCQVSINDIQINDPESLQLISDTMVSPGCPGENSGSLSVHATGGMAPYDYKWSNSESEPVLSGLGAGTYTIEVTDVNGCSFSDTFLLEDPLPIAIQFDGQDETAYAAADGNLQAQVSGGSGLFEYTWSDGSTTSGIGPRSPGNYFLTVTDGNGCTTVDSATIMAFQCLLSVNLMVTDASCFGMADGSASLDLAGANEPAPIQWSNGETGTSIEGLPAGAYQVKISDATQCSDSLDFIIKEPAELTLSIDSIRHDNGTQNGSIQASVAGGTPPYSYAWKQGIEIIRTEEDPDGLGTGSYLLVLTDANGCMVTSDTVRIDQTTAIYRDNAFQLRVHPNPTTGLLLIQSTIAFDQVEIYNSFGQQQLKSKLNRANQLNLSSLDPGMYWLKFEKEGMNTFRKVLVVK